MGEVYQYHSVHGRVVLVSGETMWLDPVERRYTLQGQLHSLSRAFINYCVDYSSLKLCRVEYQYCTDIAPATAGEGRNGGA